MSRWILALVLSLVLPFAAFAASAPAHDGIACIALDAAVDEAPAETHVDTDTTTDPDVFGAARPAPSAGSGRGAPPRFTVASLAPPFLQGPRRPPRA